MAYRTLIEAHVQIVFETDDDEPRIQIFTQRWGKTRALDTALGKDNTVHLFAKLRDELAKHNIEIRALSPVRKLHAEFVKEPVS